MSERETDTVDSPSSDTGDRATAFRRMAEAHLRDAYRLAGAILGDPTEARDAVHDAFIAAWRAWPSLRDQDKFDPWFKRIVVNECRSRLRRATRRQTRPIDPEAASPAVDPSGQADAKLLVEQSLARLKADDRVVLALRYFYDLQVDDIAAVLAVPPGTVKSRISRAQSRLRAVIERTQRGGASR